MQGSVRENSRLMVVVPVRGRPDGLAESSPFAAIDPDLDLPARFFERLRRRRLTVDSGTVDIAGVTVELCEMVAIGIDANQTGPPHDLEQWFIVVKVRPVSKEISGWLEVARQVGKVDWARYLCDLAGSDLLTHDSRGTVIASLMLEDEPELEKVALHLATRAPATEALMRVERTGIARISEVQYRVVTRRTCGFVVGNTRDSVYFSTKFGKEVENQYLLAVVLARWQLLELNALLGGAHAVWSGTGESEHLMGKTRTLRHRFNTLSELRARHSRLVGSGSFGPVFDSGSQALFWSEVTTAVGVKARYEEVADALTTLAQSTETEASLNLERLLAFFTLVIGVPSLAFTVLGVNISRLTSESGLSWLWVTLILFVCVVLGTAAFVLASGFGRGVRSELE